MRLFIIPDRVSNENKIHNRLKSSDNCRVRLHPLFNRYFILLRILRTQQQQQQKQQQQERAKNRQQVYRFMQSPFYIVEEEGAGILLP